MTPNKYYFTIKSYKNHSIKPHIFTKDGTTSINLETLDKLTSSLYQARGTLAFILEELATRGNFKARETAVYHAMRSIEDLLNENYNLANNDLNHLLAQANGIASMFIGHYKDKGRWNISSNLMEGMLNNLDNLLRKSQHIINVMAEVKGDNNE